MDLEGQRVTSNASRPMYRPTFDTSSSGCTRVRTPVRAMVLLVLVLLISMMLAWFIGSAVCRNEDADSGCAALGSIVPFT